MKPQEQQGMFKKVRSARPQAFWRAERTGVREHDKGPRTPLTPFFNISFREQGRYHQDGTDGICKAEILLNMYLV